MLYGFDSKEFSKRLKTRRTIDLNIDMRALASEIEVSPATISRIENGGLPDWDTFFKICCWMDVIPREFITPAYILKRKALKQ